MTSPEAEPKTRPWALYFALFCLTIKLLSYLDARYLTP